MKSPDALDYAMEDIEDEDDKAEFESLCQRWFEYGEYVMLEVDTEQGTCKVLER